MSSSSKTRPERLGLLDYLRYEARFNKLANRVKEACEQLSDALLTVFLTVYKHDSCTCPIKVQHDLQQILQAYTIAANQLDVLSRRFCNVFIHANSPHLAYVCLTEIMRATGGRSPFPTLQSLQPYLDRVQTYLRTDPGPPHVRVRRRWHPSESPELRLDFADLGYSCPGRRGLKADPHCVRNLTRCSREVEAALRALWPCLHEWSRVGPKLMHCDAGNPDSEYTHVLRSRLIDLASTCFSFHWLACVGILTGWSNYGAGSHTLTVEDMHGAFEHWACVQPRVPRNDDEEPFWHEVLCEACKSGIRWLSSPQRKYRARRLYRKK